MNATYNITNNRLFFWPDSRLPEAEYKACKSAGFVWWPRGCFTAIWSPSAEDWIKAQGVEIDQDDTPDDVEARVNRFERYAENDEQTATSANNRLISGTANTARRIAQAENTALSKTEEARYWHDRIAGAIAHAERHDNPRTIANRIKGLEADLRRQERRIKEHNKFMPLWTPEPISRERALQLANYDDMAGYTIWNRLQENKITPEYAREVVLMNHKTNLELCNRWINHLNMRLDYEKAYLTAAGGAELLAPKARRVSKAPEDGLKKGDTVSGRYWIAGQMRDVTGKIISMGAKSAKISLPPELDPRGVWSKGWQVNRKGLRKVS